jgi:hypothetical protein
MPPEQHTGNAVTPDLLEESGATPGVRICSSAVNPELDSAGLALRGPEGRVHAGPHRGDQRAVLRGRPLVFGVTAGRSSPTALHPNGSANASASSGLAKQNTTNSLSSQRRKYVSGVADRTPAAQNITSRFSRSGMSRAKSSGGSASRIRLRGNPIAGR